MRERTARTAGARANPRGFSFVELLIVMGVMAVLLGIAVGFFGSLGQATQLAQSKALLEETARRCRFASDGGREAILSLRIGTDDEGDPALLVGAAVARLALTHQFEDLAFASGARAPTVEGGVELKPRAGLTGNAAYFNRGALVFAPESAFAMTEGLEIEVWVKPEAAGTQMTLVTGGEPGAERYELQLVREGNSDAYNVRLRLLLRGAEEGPRIQGNPEVFESEGAPVRANGEWTHIRARFDGIAATIEVAGLDVTKLKRKRRAPGAEPKPATEAALKTIAIPASAVLGLRVGSGSKPYKGYMDNLNVRGVFRSAELEQVLPPRLVVLRPPLPLRVYFANGRLDPDEHAADVTIVIQDDANPDDLPLRITLGLHGKITSAFEAASAAPRKATP